MVLNKNMVGCGCCQKVDLVERPWAPTLGLMAHVSNKYDNRTNLDWSNATPTATVSGLPHADFNITWPLTYYTVRHDTPFPNSAVPQFPYVGRTYRHVFANGFDTLLFNLYFPFTHNNVYTQSLTPELTINESGSHYERLILPQDHYDCIAAFIHYGVSAGLDNGYSKRYGQLVGYKANAVAVNLKSTYFISQGVNIVWNLP